MIDPETIKSRDDLVAFIQGLVAELRAKPEWWENDSLELFLHACAAWLADSDGYYANRGEPSPSRPDWKNIAQMLSAAAVYE